ncbi:MAG: flagellar FlbD family protein [Myxococcales bacterium]|nr:flagellar FlbD family protein [Myxococcales bacterium]
MIWLTRTDGDQFMLNDDQILWIEPLHDTIVVLHSGDRLRVLESGDEIKERIIHWRRKLLGLSFFSADEVDSGE